MKLKFYISKLRPEAYVVVSASNGSDYRIEHRHGIDLITSIKALKEWSDDHSTIFLIQNDFGIAIIMLDSGFCLTRYAGFPIKDSLEEVEL